MNRLALNRLEIEFLTESFPIAIGDVLTMATIPVPRSDALSLLRRFHDLGFISFRMFIMSRARKGVGFDEILGGPALVVNDAFWLWLEQSSEVWNRITADRERDWDLIVDTTDLFTEQYFTPDDREFWKLINQE